MGIINSLLLHNTHYVIINTENTAQFHYGKYITGAAGRIRKSSSQNIFNNPHITDTSLSSIMKKISRRKITVAGSSFIVTAFFSIISLLLYFIVPLLVAWYILPFCLVGIFIPTVFILNKFSCHVRLRYTLNGKKSDFYQELLHHLTHLSYSDKLWHVNEIVPNRNLKKYGGSKQIYHRCQAKVMKARPHFITSNITIYSITYSHHSLYFLPDCILVRKNNTYSHYLYSDIFLYYAEKPSLERKNPPEDAPIMGYRWLHPNKDGSRDKRYRYNPRIPLMLLSELLIYFKGGFQSYLQVSSMGITFSFYSFLGLFAEVAITKKYKRRPGQSGGSARSKKEENQRTEKKQASERKQNERTYEKKYADEKIDEKNSNEVNQKQVDKVTLNAFRTLGLLPGASAEDIKHNYRLLVKRYHPDLYVKSTDMSKKYAEYKIIEINKAYEYILKWSTAT
jgi:hypothetical protein